MVETITNEILAALSAEALGRLRAKMQVVPLAARQLLHEHDRPINFVYFPLTAVVSFIVSFDDGFQMEAGLVGREGVVGLSVFHGAGSEIADAMVIYPGEAFRISASQFRQEIEAIPSLNRELLRFSDATRMQAMQMSACNAHHSLEQRLARWLLMVRDRVAGNELPVTQELLASILCVHRPSVTVAASRLQRANLIRYAGGQLTILDRPGLERVACECSRLLWQRNRRQR